MILTVLMLLTQSAAGAVPAPTAAVLQPAFRNTIVSTYPDGRTARLWLSADGTYAGQGRRGGRNSGVWRLRGSEICMSQRRPVPVPIQYCTPVMQGGVGTRWTAKAVTGETIQVQVVSGRPN